MKRNILYSAGLLLFFVMGYLSSALNAFDANAQTNQPNPKAAYLLASGVISSQEAMQPYVDKAGPLAAEAGMKMLGSGESGTTVHLLEGKWPYQGVVLVEKYSSMEALLKFWNSPGYQEAKKLRAGVVDINFIIAVEGVE